MLIGQIIASRYSACGSAGVSGYGRCRSDSKKNLATVHPVADEPEDEEDRRLLNDGSVDFAEEFEHVVAEVDCQRVLNPAGDQP